MPETSAAESMKKSSSRSRLHTEGNVGSIKFDGSNNNIISGMVFKKSKNQIKKWQLKEKIGYNEFINTNETNVIRLIPREKKRRIYALMDLYGFTEEEAIAEDDRLTSRFNERSSAESSGAAPLALPARAEMLYDDRLDRKIDPITFLRQQWGRYMDAGILYQDDLGRLDPKLIPAIGSYCQRMRKKFPQRAAEFDAKNFIPPLKPRELKLKRSDGAEPGSAEFEAQRRREYQRERQAHYRAQRRTSVEPA